MIELTNITKKYYKGTEAEISALDNISLNIDDGELTAVTGESGSGKSTLLNIIGCLDTADSGEYRLNDKRISGISRNDLAEIRSKQIGFVLQEFGLMLDRSVYHNLTYPLIFNSSVKKRDYNDKIKEVLEMVGLSDRINSKCNELSGGQKQRIAIARALINNPDIILADEPTGALDTKTSAEIMELFKSLNKNGKTIVIVTHDPKVAEKCGRVIEISDGKIIDACGA